MHYPIAIHKDAKSDYGVSVPDLPGCISAGATIEDALAMAREAIELHLIGLIEEGGFPPEPTPIEQWREDPDFAGATWAVVRIEESNLSPKAQRVQITLPERLLIAVDEFADRHDQTRSGLLARAVWEYMGRGDPGREPGPARRVRAAPGKAGNKAKGKAPKRSTPKGAASTGKPRGKAPAKRTGPARRAK
ncbi:MAG: type II toxin-antitoxin system HicB family antitoxin [Phycisphaerales bacterium JB060]